MPTFQQVQTAAEIAAKAAMDSVPAGLVYGNVSNATFYQGTTPWAHVVVIEQTDSQLGLGDTVPSRTRGTVVFTFYVKKGQGMGKHTQMREAVKARFRSKAIGGATFLNARSTVLGETDTWSLTGVEVPFYFDRHS